MGPVIREDSGLYPDILYGMTKAVNEEMVRIYRFQYALPITVLRPNNIMGCAEIPGGWRASVVIGSLKRGATNPHATFYVPVQCDELGKDHVDVKLPNQWQFEFDLSKTGKLPGFNPEYDSKRMADDAIAFLNGKDIGVLPPAFAH